jgi:hypothetical protein
MPTSFFLVRAVVAEPLRDKFDPWTSTDHLPRALADFKAEKCWRFWSKRSPDGAKRNPGYGFSVAPDCAVLYPGHTAS